MITEFCVIRLQFPTVGGERINGGPKAQMLAHTKTGSSFSIE